MGTLHFDCFAGISGDMTLGAMVDLGCDPDELRRELQKLGLAGWELEFRREQRCGIGGTHAEVRCHGHDHEHCHEHEHRHEHHEHHHTTWKEIRALIERSGISDGAKKRAQHIFRLIAGAEAQVHGLPADEVAFHEVGAVDSIIDIVGAAVCLEMLKPDRITCGAVELGGGAAHCAHGELPVPAPATLILVRGMPVTAGGFNKEMTTPTGAAILAASVDEFITAGSFREIKTGYGAGTHQFDKPNLLRLSWREELAPMAVANNAWRTEELILLETNIDDMSGEALGFFMESLFASGALDVTMTPCVMKKSRPGTVVSALASSEKIEALRRCFFEKSSAIGFREIPVRRQALKREERVSSSAFGEARRKTVFLGDRILRSKIEFEDRARLARERSISLDEAERLLSAPENTDGRE